MLKFNEYNQDFTNFVLTKYVPNGIEPAAYILYNDILKLDKICKNIIYDVRISNKLLDKEQVRNFIELVEFSNQLNKLCKKWDEAQKSWVCDGNKVKVVLDCILLDKQETFIVMYAEFMDLFCYRNYYVNNLKTKEVISKIG